MRARNPLRYLETLGLDSRRLPRSLVLAGVVLGLSFVGLWLLGEAWQQPVRVCWTCPSTWLVLLTLCGLSLLQAVVAALLPAALLPNLLTKSRLKLLLCITVVSSMINSLAPAKAGLAVKAVLFKRQLGVEYSRFAVIHVASSGIVILISVAVVVLSYLGEVLELSSKYASGLGDSAKWLFPVISGVLLAAIVLTICWRGGIARTLHRLAWILKSLTIGRAASVTGLVTLCGILQLALIGVRAMMAAQLFGATPEWEAAMIFGAVLSLAPVISILPGGVGIREAMFVLAGTIAGLPSEVSLAAALVDRIAGTVTMVLVGGVGLHKLCETKPVSM